MLAQLPNGNATCPYGGTLLTSGSSNTYVCNGAPAPGGSVTYSGGFPPVTFAGYTAQTYTGNLGGRAGAHALCGAAFAGSHFCADWEVDVATPPAAPGSVWVDNGNNQTSSRFYRSPESSTDVYDCAGWTTASPSLMPNGSGTARASTLTSTGAIVTSFVGLNDGGCENARPLACCDGYPPE
jgi:hypothetical protein